jgi:hypothetical protein
MEHEFEVLSALLDGADVNDWEVAAALEDPKGRQALVEFVRLRQLARTDDVRPSADFLARANGALSPKRTARRGVPWPWAAAAVLIAALGGSLLQTDVLRRDGASSPPHASRVLRFEPGVDWQP